jgi:hypothetical protein
MVLLQRITLLKRITLPNGTAAEPTVDLPVSPPAVPSSIPRALARRPMMFLAKRMPVRARGSGTRLPARANAAACASNTPMHFAVTGTKRRARRPRKSKRFQTEDGIALTTTGSARAQRPRFCGPLWLSRLFLERSPLSSSEEGSRTPPLGRTSGGVLVLRMTRRLACHRAPPSARRVHFLRSAR